LINKKLAASAVAVITQVPWADLLVTGMQKVNERQGKYEYEDIMDTLSLDELYNNIFLHLHLHY
jgi:hypothetical protein